MTWPSRSTRGAVAGIAPTAPFSAGLDTGAKHRYTGSHNGQRRACRFDRPGVNQERAMRHVGVREFKDKATSLLSAGEPLVIERHGKPIGFYLPVQARDRAIGQAALDRLGRTVEEILARTGLSEDELVAALTTDDGLA